MNKTLKGKLWRVFSLWVRLRDANTKGYTSCISCGEKHKWDELDAGHFVPKSRGNSIYFDEQNVNSQCRKCNCFLHGNLYLYGKNIDLKYGSGTADRLIKKSNEIKKYGVKELKNLIEVYQSQVAELRKIKAL